MTTTSTYEAINRLILWKLPPLPVSPAQDAHKYPKLNKVLGIELDKDGNPVPRFTGKNPSYLDSVGIPHLIPHAAFQSRIPSSQETERWFSNSANGIGTLGGWHGIIWLDFDAKRFDSQETCDRTVEDWIVAHAMQYTFTERTHSGGWRIGVRVRQMPSFTNFSLAPAGGHHIGEALGRGRFTVLAPTIGPSGNAYCSINATYPILVESLETIGIYPYKATPESNPEAAKLVQKASRQFRKTDCRLASFHLGEETANRPELPLLHLISASARRVLAGTKHIKMGERSNALILLAREAYGWENWAWKNGYSVTPCAQQVCEEAGLEMGLECDRIERILKCKQSKSLRDCTPAIYRLRGDIGCWRKVLSVIAAQK